MDANTQLINTWNTLDEDDGRITADEALAEMIEDGEDIKAMVDHFDGIVTVAIRRARINRILSNIRSHFGLDAGLYLYIAI